MIAVPALYGMYERANAEMDAGVDAFESLDARDLEMWTRFAEIVSEEVYGRRYPQAEEMECSE